MDKLSWQLKMITESESMKSGDRKTIEATILRLDGHISPEPIDVFFAWPGGDTLTSEGLRINTSDRDYYDAILNKGQDGYIGKAVISKALNAPVVVTAVAVKGFDGKTRGLLAFQFKLDTLSTITGGIKAGRTGYGWIMDNTGPMIAHPNAKAIMAMNVTNTDKDGYRGMDAVGKNALSEESAHGNFRTPAGAEMTMFSVHVPDTPGWVLGLSVPMSELQETAKSLTNVLLLLALVSIILAVIMAIGFAQWIMTPIKTIADGLGLMSNGDLLFSSQDKETRGPNRGTAR